MNIKSNNVYFYLRISTKETQDKQSYSRQVNALKTYAKKNGLEYNERDIFKDDVSGITFERKEWKELMKRVKEGDCIIFKDIARFTRQADEGYNVYKKLMENGIELKFLDNPTVSTDYIKNLLNIAEEQERVAKVTLEAIIKILLTVELDRVERERQILVKRIKDGIKASDKKSGREKGQLMKMSEELKEDIEKYLRDRTIKQVDLMKKYKLTRNTLIKYITYIKIENTTKSNF
ncbi:MAG: recombinase family protein [Peptostreptococcaceae bacterium]